MKKLILAALTLALVLGASPCAWGAIAERHTVDVENNLHTGDVHISLEEFQLDDSRNRIPYEDPKTVLPGQRVSKIVTIRNAARPCWIRMKVAWSGTGDTDFLDPEEDGLQIGEQWEQHGDYWYLKSPLDSGASADFMTGFRIPSTFGNEVEGGTFRIDLTAQAVQSEHFIPAWDSPDPWSGTLIEECVHSAYSTPEKGSQSFRVEVRSSAEGFVKTGDDFFSNWDRLMPGDTVSDHVEIRNLHEPVHIYFQTSTRTDDPELQKLLSAVRLRITKKDGTEIFHSSLTDVIQEPLLLGVFGTGESDTLTYTVTVPTWLKNGYALRDAATTWIFTAEVEQTDFTLPRTGGAGPGPILLLGLGLTAAGLSLIHRKGRVPNEA